MKFLLLGTWIVAGFPPSSYQLEFNTAEKCGRARQAVLNDYVRMHWVHPYEPVNDRVSAVCVVR